MRSDRRQPHSSADALTPGQANGTRSKKDLHAKENTKEQRHRDLSIRKADRRDADNPRRHQLGPDHEAIHLLRSVHERLHRADADYAGHRVRAMEHISAALRHLGAPDALDAILLVNAGNRPQWESDQILRDAIRSLNRVEGMLGTGTNHPAHHHRRAPPSPRRSARFTSPCESANARLSFNGAWASSFQDRCGVVSCRGESSLPIGESRGRWPRRAKPKFCALSFAALSVNIHRFLPHEPRRGRFRASCGIVSKLLAAFGPVTACPRASGQARSVGPGATNAAQGPSKRRPVPRVVGS